VLISSFFFRWLKCSFFLHCIFKILFIWLIYFWDNCYLKTGAEYRDFFSCKSFIKISIPFTIFAILNNHTMLNKNIKLIAGLIVIVSVWRLRNNNVVAGYSFYWWLALSRRFLLISNGPDLFFVPDRADFKDKRMVYHFIKTACS
jgi:hypothetical protein